MYLSVKPNSCKRCCFRTPPTCTPLPSLWSPISHLPLQYYAPSASFILYSGFPASNLLGPFWFCSHVCPYEVFSSVRHTSVLPPDSFALRQPFTPFLCTRFFSITRNDNKLDGLVGNIPGSFFLFHSSPGWICQFIQSVSQFCLIWPIYFCSLWEDRPCFYPFYTCHIIVEPLWNGAPSPLGPCRGMNLQTVCRYWWDNR